MSQLSQLIEQARKTRRLEDIFNIRPSPAPSMPYPADPDRLLSSLNVLESSLLFHPTISSQAISGQSINDLVSELEAVASGL